jgi:hypothetical protein
VGLHLGAESYFVAAQQQSMQQQSTQSTAVRTSLSLSQLQASHRGCWASLQNVGGNPANSTSQVVHGSSRAQCALGLILASGRGHRPREIGPGPPGALTRP